MFRNGSMPCLLFALCLQLMNDVRGTHGRHNGVSCSKLKKKAMEVPNSNKIRGLLEFMDLNGTVTVIIDVFSRFESSWTRMTHPHKFKDRVCTLLAENPSGYEFPYGRPDHASGKMGEKRK